MKLPSTNVEAIATGAPHYQDPFWKMVALEKVGLVVSLVQSVGDTKGVWSWTIECRAYWPQKDGESLQCGKRIKLTRESTLIDTEELLICKLRLEYADDLSTLEGSADLTNSRVITHVHYKGWEDCSVPETEE